LDRCCRLEESGDDVDCFWRLLGLPLILSALIILAMAPETLLAAVEEEEGANRMELFWRVPKGTRLEEVVVVGGRAVVDAAAKAWAFPLFAATTADTG